MRLDLDGLIRRGQRRSSSSLGIGSSKDDPTVLHHGVGFRVADWIVSRLPFIVIKEPERVFVAFASIIMGLLMLFPPSRPDSIVSTLDSFTSVLWALAFLGGGVAKIIGLSITSRLRGRIANIRRYETGRSFERMGASFIALATFVYAAVILKSRGAPAILVAVMFTGLALTNLVRLLVSVAGRDIKIEEVAE